MESDPVAQRALLVSVFKSGSGQKEVSEEHLQELVLLTQTYGVEVVYKTTCLVRRYDGSTYVTEGKLKELIDAAKEHKATLVIFDDEILPSQQRNLE